MVDPEFKKHPAYKRTTIYAFRTLGARIIKLGRAMGLYRFVGYLNKNLRMPKPAKTKN